ncbi:ArsR/SmtB family transcription factor [Allorhizocola rhizosphaerae]|uniref:ArsR/SmtB family transcription factor n=1 Tax=Allorhizocola rhizosphaerae TaxID=1872709 RepID=UPI000E3B90C8|nr:helix-turn-helix domain-containing protein [Allorhizocola rhizosphaerae]
MAWRIHFTADDLARTRVAPTLGPLAETLLGFSLLRARDKPPVALAGWQADARQRLSPAMRPLAALIRGRRFGVDLWTLTGAAPTIEQGLRALIAIRPEDARAELEFFAAESPLPTDAWRIADRADLGRRLLANSAHATYSALLEPYWPRVHAHLHAERLSRSRLLLDGGVERLFASLGPWVRWRSPVLEIHARPDFDLRLEGRGFELVPSMFVGDRPLLLFDLASPVSPARLVFSAARDPAPLTNGSTRNGGALGALIGRTRAAALARTAYGCSTSELASHLGVSVAAASQHATVLRDNGLIMTRREGSSVLHTLTPLGAEMLKVSSGEAVLLRGGARPRSDPSPAAAENAVNDSRERDLDWNLFS